MTAVVLFTEQHLRAGSADVIVTQSAGALHVRRTGVRWHNDGDFQWDGPTGTRPRLPWYLLSPRLYAAMTARRYRTGHLHAELL